MDINIRYNYILYSCLLCIMFRTGFIISGVWSADYSIGENQSHLLLIRMDQL